MKPVLHSNSSYKIMEDTALSAGTDMFIVYFILFSFNLDLVIFVLLIENLFLLICSCLINLLIIEEN